MAKNESNLSLQSNSRVPSLELTADRAEAELKQCKPKRPKAKTATVNQAAEPSSAERRPREERPGVLVCGGVALVCWLGIPDNGWLPLLGLVIQKLLS
jgi:hypothetical protein